MSRRNRGNPLHKTWAICVIARRRFAGGPRGDAADTVEALCICSLNSSAGVVYEMCSSSKRSGIIVIPNLEKQHLTWEVVAKCELRGGAR